MTTAINIFVLFVATSCGPQQVQSNLAADEPASVAIQLQDDSVLNAFDVDQRKLDSVGRIA